MLGHCTTYLSKPVTILGQVPTCYAALCLKRQDQYSRVGYTSTVSLALYLTHSYLRDRHSLLIPYLIKNQKHNTDM